MSVLFRPWVSLKNDASGDSHMVVHKVDLKKDDESWVEAWHAYIEKGVANQHLAWYIQNFQAVYSVREGDDIDEGSNAAAKDNVAMNIGNDNLGDVLGTTMGNSRDFGADDAASIWGDIRLSLVLAPYNLRVLAA
jgi:hypothetical protein